MKNKLGIGPLTKLVYIGTLVGITIFYQYSCEGFFKKIFVSYILTKS